ncbi:MAG: GDP-mannose 4,6-dehydratase [Pseudobdellovibrio sp.]
MTKKTALISGISGQDGSYLAELLVEKNYRVVGLTRKFSEEVPKSLAHIKNKIEVKYCNYTENSIMEILREINPDEIYNLAGQAYVGKSWDLVPDTVQINGLIPIYFVEAIYKINRKIKFFQASSSEVFSPAPDEVLTEKSPIKPSNPYGCSKAFAHQMVSLFRQAYGIYLVNGIFFNHESSRRSSEFLTKKVIASAVSIKLGKQSELALGNLGAKRDWGYAPDYMEAAHAMMNLEKPEDLIIASRNIRSVEDLVISVFKELNLDWKQFVKIDPKLFRPLETPTVQGSPDRIFQLTGWKPKVSFDEMIKLMVHDEMKAQTGSLEKLI